MKYERRKGIKSFCSSIALLFLWSATNRTHIHTQTSFSLSCCYRDTNKIVRNTEMFFPALAQVTRAVDSWNAQRARVQEQGTNTVRLMSCSKEHNKQYKQKEAEPTVIHSGLIQTNMAL